MKSGVEQGDDLAPRCLVKETEMGMTDTEREILREKDEETRLGERVPFESARQATYEDSVAPDDGWENED